MDGEHCLDEPWHDAAPYHVHVARNWYLLERYGSFACQCQRKPIVAAAQVGNRGHCSDFRRSSHRLWKLEAQVIVRGNLAIDLDFGGAGAIRDA